jgi:hypothetical protein
MSKPSRWRFLVEMPAPYNPSTRPDGMRESQWGRTWTLERDDGKRAVVEIETSQAALDAYIAGTLPPTARLAIQTEGRSAIEEHLGEAKLPTAIHITGAGIRRRR